MLVERARHFLYLDEHNSVIVGLRVFPILKRHLGFNLSYREGSSEERRIRRSGVISHNRFASLDNFSPTPYLESTEHSWEMFVGKTTELKLDKR